LYLVEEVNAVPEAYLRYTIINGSEHETMTWWVFWAYLCRTITKMAVPEVMSNKWDHAGHSYRNVAQ
jgi:hypothetical protein